MASVGFMPTGVELVKAEVSKHSGEGWVVLDIAMFLTGRLAPFRFEFNAIGHEADEGQEKFDGHCVSLPSGLRGVGVACDYRA